MDNSFDQLLKRRILEHAERAVANAAELSDGMSAAMEARLERSRQAVAKHIAAYPVTKEQNHKYYANKKARREAEFAAMSPEERAATLEAERLERKRRYDAISPEKKREYAARRYARRKAKMAAMLAQNETKENDDDET